MARKVCVLLLAVLLAHAASASQDVPASLGKPLMSWKRIATDAAQVAFEQVMHACVVTKNNHQEHLRDCVHVAGTCIPSETGNEVGERGDKGRSNEHAEGARDAVPQYLVVRYRC
jgi:hypothetical protein